MGRNLNERGNRRKMRKGERDYGRKRSGKRNRLG